MCFGWLLESSIELPKRDHNHSLGKFEFSKADHYKLRGNLPQMIELIVIFCAIRAQVKSSPLLVCA